MIRKSYLMIGIPIYYPNLPMIDKNSTSAFDTRESHELSKFVILSCMLW